jgi:glycine/D-amino acid oxidase-like deaminating enzyme
LFDYIVVGAGIVGLATAYHLKRLDPDSSVLVVDKESGPGAGDTGRSAAAFRVFFTGRLNMLLAGSSVEFYRHVQEDKGYDLGMMWVGYLFLLDEEGLKRVEEGLNEAERMGLPFKRLDPRVVEERMGLRAGVSGLEEAEIVGTGDIVDAVLIEKAGIMDPERLVRYYYEKLQSMGVEFAFDTRVEGFIVEPRRPLGVEGEPFAWQEARVSGIRVAGGREIRARRKVIAALGAWSPLLLDEIGVDSYSRPKKRQVFVVKADGERARVLRARGLNRYGIAPMTILPKGVYMRPEPGEGTFWVGVSDNLGRPYKLEEPPHPEEDFYTLSILPVLSLYFPQFQDAYPQAAWAGHYDISFDSQPIVYEPYDSDLIVAAGTSGSGIMKADAIGRVAASLALGMEEAELYGGEAIPVKWLGIEGRLLEEEKLVI